jgi:opacity protein-like surface antigen
MFGQKNNSTIIHFKDDSSKQFDKVSFEYSIDDYIIGFEAKTDTNKKIKYNLTDIISLKDNSSSYIVKQVNKDSYLVEELIIGSLSLYKSGDHYFLENEEYGFREITKAEIDGTTLNSYNYSTLSVYINKCKKAQEEAYNKNTSIIPSVIKSIVETYNSCDLSEDTQFAENVIKQANAPYETIEIGVNIGYSFLNASFDELSPDVSNSFGVPVIGAQVYFNTNILEKALGFLIIVDYSFPSEFNASDNNIYLKSKLSYINAMIGTRYTFNNINKTFSPYLGFNAGFIFNSMSNITVQENIFGAQFLDFNSTNKLAYNVGIGTYIHFGKQKIDFNITYQPENTFELLSTDSLSKFESSYKVSGFQLKATYVF